MTEAAMPLGDSTARHVAGAPSSLAALHFERTTVS